MKTHHFKGEVDYDLEHDILLFKAKDRDYKKSFELENLIIDVDVEDLITGVQIFDASKFFQTTKVALRDIKNMKLESTVENNRVEIRLMFQVTVRNKIIEKNPIFVESIKGPLPNTQVVCVMN